jgi:hypothetical protein
MFSSSLYLAMLHFPGAQSFLPPFPADLVERPGKTHPETKASLSDLHKKTIHIPKD